MPDLMGNSEGQIQHTSGKSDNMCLTIGAKRQEEKQKGKGTRDRDQ